LAISVSVPKDLSGIKTKVALNLTKRQLVCFSMAAVVGIPLYFFTKRVAGTQISTYLMITFMLPFFSWQCMKKMDFRQKKFYIF